jgi:hypothetical protein
MSNPYIHQLNAIIAPEYQLLFGDGDSTCAAAAHEFELLGDMIEDDQNPYFVCVVNNQRGVVAFAAYIIPSCTIDSLESTQVGAGKLAVLAAIAHLSYYCPDHILVRDATDRMPNKLPYYEQFGFRQHGSSARDFRLDLNSGDFPSNFMDTMRSKAFPARHS